MDMILLGTIVLFFIATAIWLKNFFNKRKQKKIMIEHQIMHYKRNMQIIEESIYYAENSKNFETRKSRIALVIKISNELLEEYPEDESVKKILENALVIQKSIHTLSIFAVIKKLTDRANAAKTDTAKINNATKAILAISEVRDDPFVDQEQLDIWEENLNEFISNVQFNKLNEKAEKFEFKGQTSKAVDAYMDALYHLKNDDIDDEKQQEQIEEIQQKIKYLTGDASKKHQ